MPKARVIYKWRKSLTVTFAIANTVNIGDCSGAQLINLFDKISVLVDRFGLYCLVEKGLNWLARIATNVGGEMLSTVVVEAIRFGKELRN